MQLHKQSQWVPSTYLAVHLLNEHCAASELTDLLGCWLMSQTPHFTIQVRIQIVEETLDLRWNANNQYNHNPAVIEDHLSTT